MLQGRGIPEKVDPPPTPISPTKVSECGPIKANATVAG